MDKVFFKIKKDCHAGFTLMELMIALVIVAILATLAVPMYIQHVTKTRRVDGKSALIDLAARMERQYAENHTYSNATIASNPTTDILSTNLSPEGFYQLSIVSKNATSYILQALPVPGSTQATNDAECAGFRINSLGQKTITGTGNAQTCWR